MSFHPQNINKIIPTKESWENFGKNIDKFLESNKDRLVKDDFDVIAGFSRGGALLATTLHSSLTDKFLYYGKDSKLFLRNIPSEISKRDYREPCFVMGKAASSEDLNDLNKLIKELNNLRNDVPKGKTVNLLLIDDNLTGSTRMNFFAEEIRKRGYIGVFTLAYVRHPLFFSPQLDYIVREFPEGTDYFIMPWHEPHLEPRATKIDREHTTIKFEFKISSAFDFRELYSQIKKLNYIERIEITENEIDFKRGESQVYIKRKKGRLMVVPVRRKFYPPKSCLDENKPAFSNLSLCRLGGEMNQSNICRTCSFLNCNKDAIDLIFNTEGVFNELYIDPLTSSIGTGKLISSIREWIDRRSRMEKNLKCLSEKRTAHDPFAIPLNEFEKLSAKQWGVLAEEAYNLCKEKIEDTFREEPQIKYIVVCDKEIILTAADPSLVSGGKIKNLITSRGEPCYVFSRKLLIEESCWSRVKNGDFYPTIELILGGKLWNEKEVEEKGKKVVADFDTGNPVDHAIISEAFSKEITYSSTAYEWRRSEYRDKPFIYFERDIKIGIKDKTGKLKCKEFPVIFVVDWEKKECPFRETSPNRTGFIGRYFMFSFNFKITLNPSTKASLVEYIS